MELPVSQSTVNVIGMHFTPTTTAEMSDALRICREEADIDVIVITGTGDRHSVREATRM